MIDNLCPHCGGVMPVSNELKKLSFDDIKRFVGESMDINMDVITSKHLLEDESLAKHMVYYFAYYYTLYSINKISALYGNHRASVIYGARRIDQDIRINYDVKVLVNDILGKMKDGNILIKRHYGRRGVKERMNNPPKHNWAKKVLVIKRDNGDKYEALSIHHASYYTGVHVSNISSECRGLSKSKSNYTFKFI